MNTTDSPLLDAAQRLHDIHNRMSKAARLASRKPEETRLIAVSKTFGPEDIKPLLQAGQRLFGENRVQEAQGKWPALKEKYPGVELHLVGQLQSNKAEDAVRLFDVIHSVDRSSLAKALAKAMEKTGQRPDCFIQVNIGEEEQKGGVSIDALPALLTETETLGLPIIGLMCVPPVEKDPAPYFALLSKLAKRHNLPRLSMGMSSDFETAIKLGATEIRVGTALFGSR